LIVTDLAVIKVTPEGLVLLEVTPGYTPEEIKAVTEPRLTISPDLKEIVVTVAVARPGGLILLFGINESARPPFPVAEAIRKELGETDDTQRETRSWRARSRRRACLPTCARRRIVSWRGSPAIPPQAAEYTVARTYLEWLCEMPWAVGTVADLEKEGRLRRNGHGYEVLTF
jgi:hypothetical protein